MSIMKLELGEENIRAVVSEFADCEFNDKRLRFRVVEVATSLFSRQSSIIFSAINGNAEKKATYNFFKNVKVSAKKIQTPHFKNTIDKIESNKETTLLIQDTSYANLKLKAPFQNSKSYIGKTSKGEVLHGFAIHSTFAISQNGLPLGLLNQSIYQHTNNDCKDSNLAIEEKESYRWLEGLKIAKESVSSNNVIHICDREADIFEVLSYGYKHNEKFIIRMAQDRRTGVERRKSEGLITERLAVIDTIDTKEVQIYDQASSQYVTRNMGIKWTELYLPLPQNKVIKGEKDCNSPIKITALEVRSLDKGQEIKWILLTNLNVSGHEEAFTIINYYKQRWHIENYHKVLKSGFGIEDARLESVEGLENLYALLSILAVKLYYLIHLSRVDKEMSCEEILERHEWQALLIQSKKARIQDIIELKPPTIGEAVTMIAQLGGYMNRKKDLPPGIIVIWRGWQRLSEIASYHKLISPSTNTYG